jgi:hypothetical protein
MSNKDSTFAPDAQRLSALLKAQPLQRLMRGSQNFKALQQLIAEIIPDSIRNNITGFALDQDVLVIATHSGSFATHLRAYRSDLLYGAERYSFLGRLKDVKIIIRPVKAKTRPKRERQRALPKRTSPQTLELIETIAKNCENNVLKCALSRLAQNLQIYSNQSDND